MKDKTKQAARGPIVAKGRDPMGAGVEQARRHKEAAAFYTQPGGKVPNNTVVGRRDFMEVLNENASLRSNLYNDWSGPTPPLQMGIQPPHNKWIDTLTAGWTDTDMLAAIGTANPAMTLRARTIEQYGPTPLPAGENPLVGAPGVNATTQVGISGPVAPMAPPVPSLRGKDGFLPGQIQMPDLQAVSPLIPADSVSLDPTQFQNRSIVGDPAAARLPRMDSSRALDPRKVKGRPSTMPPAGA